MTTAREPKRQHWIAPSILSADFARLGEEVDAVLAAGADLIHFDVMDNHYVPNLTIGPLVCEALRKHGVTAPIDVHLMVKPVDASSRTSRPPARPTSASIPRRPSTSIAALQLIREHGCKAGLVFNPATPLDWLDYVLEQLDLVLHDVGESRLRRPEFIDAALREDRDGARRARSRRAADPARGRRRREGRRTSAASPRPAPTRSSRARRSSARRITRRRSTRCGASSRPLADAVCAALRATRRTRLRVPFCYARAPKTAGWLAVSWSGPFTSLVARAWPTLPACVASRASSRRSPTTSASSCRR